LKENLRQLDGKGLVRLYSVLSWAKITLITEGVKTPEVLGAQALILLAASGVDQR
jgi:hypothetical protein